MKAISIHQPYANFIAHGLKRYETRSWSPSSSLLGMRIAFHASKTTLSTNVFCDPMQCDEAVMLHRKRALESINWGKQAIPLGAIVATGVLSLVIGTDSPLAHDVGPFEKALGNWESATHAWQLDDMIMLDEPIPFTGKQGFFNVPNKLIPEYAR